VSENSQKIHQIHGIKIGYTDKKITSYGGFSIIAAFFKKVGVKEALVKIMPIKETSPNAMKADEKILGFMTLLLSGANRFSHMLYVGDPESIKSLFSLNRLPLAGTTLTRYFNKIKTMWESEQVSERIWIYIKSIVDWGKIKSDWLSFDSTVMTRYGKQEGAQKGYNPDKKGRPSHHPLLAFLNESRMVLNIWNRSGNTSSGNNIIAFFESVYDRIKDLIILKGVLADSGFYNKEFIETIESKKLKYIITAKLYYTLQREIYSHDKWKQIEPGLWISEIEFKHEEWKKSLRYVIVRQSVKQRKEALGKQLRLFEIETEIYRYGCWVTNVDDDPLDVWRTIRKRSNDENTIKEFKEDLALCGFSMHSFYATEVAMLIRLLLYNLLLVFRTTFLPKNESAQRISTLRFKYFIIPAHLGRDSSGRWLRLSVFPTKLKTRIQAILDAISIYSLPNTQLHCS